MAIESQAHSHIGQNVIAFRFALGDRVRIEAIETWGRVECCMVQNAGKRYEVSYFDEDKVRRVEWMHEDELSRGRV